ncbi:MAG: helix-turn-helix transcriptional regulator [Parasporobacterium sp.]|nr:helix-turn-helix transcriptional regulator [Parasporobacterium sp.]
MQDLKLAEGKKLLEKTALSIEEISSIIGYNSSDHFARMFRKENGISPHEYRKQNRKRSD